ncbi:acyltransferase family protein [Halothiobacillus sp. DCM-1]|uniref:acyltransferase family protein n=1 Tax=Halothiobacillus sp. DCM-1 TaxID=3112558 RepID=UPI00324F618C
MAQHKQAPIATPGYRPDLQALRAFAILLVVADHAQLVGFAGGYVGVDVFFVLSGYLITGLITNEVFQTRRFDALNFYVRRLKGHAAGCPVPAQN